MRGVWVVAALLIAASASADTSPTLDAALANAARNRKPLVIEFYADWCLPCRYFDAKVLPRADVAAALRSVEFVRYDIDTAPGEQIAEKLGVTGVPTFMVLDASGNVLARHAGLGGGAKVPHHWFIAMLARARQDRVSTEELEAAVAAQPMDVTVRLKLARHYRSIGRITDAAEHFAWVADNVTGLRELVAEAAAERDAMLGAETRLADAVSAAEQFVDTYPESRLSSFRLVALAQSGRVTRARIVELARKHLDATALPQWPNAVRAALLANVELLAIGSMDVREAKHAAEPVIQLLRAELALFRGELALAAARVGAGCRLPGNELWCYQLRQALDLKQQFTAGIERLRGFAADYLAALEHPEPRTKDYGIEALGDVDPAFGNAVAASFAHARDACEYLATRNVSLVVSLELAASGRPMRVGIRGNESELARCVQRSIAKAPLPEAPIALEGHVHGSLTFDAWRASTRPRPHVRFAGVLPQIAVRRGDLETMGFRANGVVELAKGRRVRLLAGSTAEFAGADTGNPAYRLRALVGAAVPSLFASRIRVVGLVGAGIRDLGTKAPRAFELALEERVIVPIGKLRLHATAELSSHEMGYGCGASLPFNGVRLYVGAQHGSIGTGTATMFVFGTAVGDAY